LKILFLLFIIFWSASCVKYRSPQDRSDYVKGHDAAWKYAKQDVLASNCMGGYPRNTRPLARKYTQRLQDQGRSEAFISGFYFGYEKSYPEFYDLYCDDIFELKK
jgi:hypothetical protein